MVIIIMICKGAEKDIDHPGMETSTTFSNKKGKKLVKIKSQPTLKIFL